MWWLFSTKLIDVNEMAPSRDHLHNSWDSSYDCVQATQTLNSKEIITENYQHPSNPYDNHDVICTLKYWYYCIIQDNKFNGPTWGPPGSSRAQMGPMLAPWTLLHVWGDVFIGWPHLADNGCKVSVVNFVRALGRVEFTLIVGGETCVDV